MKQFTFSGCTFKNADGATNTTGIHVKGDGVVFDVINTSFETTVGVKVEDQDKAYLPELAKLLRQSHISKEDFVELIESFQGNSDEAQSRQIVEESFIYKTLSVAADVVGLSQFIVAIGMSPQWKDFLAILFK